MLLDSRSLAGDIAVRLFSYVSSIGLLCGVSLLVVYWWTPRRLSWLRSWNTWVVVGMLVFTIVGEYVLSPQMAALRLEANGELIPDSPLQQEFAKLHAVSSILFVVNSLLGLLLVILPNSPSTNRGPEKSVHRVE